MAASYNESKSQIKNDQSKKYKESFEFLKEIGEGSFSTVYLAKDKKSQTLFAIKECNKSQILKENKVKYIHLEKKILAEYLNNHPFFIKLCFTFQDDDNLYFGLNYCSNGDLLEYIKKYNGFSIDRTKFYSAELTDALEYMHGKQIVHRDLKPENILLDENYHIKLTDFGTAKILNQIEDICHATDKHDSYTEQKEKTIVKRKNSFVGTAQFVAPEILQGKNPTIACDLWSFGCIIFQMVTNKHLFTGNHEYDIFQKIVKRSFVIPEEFNQDCSDLIRKLVVSEPNERLGVRGYDLLKSHIFFKDISWKDLCKQQPPD